MKAYLFIAVFLLHALCASAQPVNWPSPEVEQLYNNARKNFTSGQLQAAIAGYQQAITLAPDVPLLYRDLGQALYRSGRYKEADEVLASLIDKGNGDEYTYQAAAASKWAQKEDKAAHRILQKGLIVFPASGLLYHEKGTYYDDKREDEAALREWLAGIAADPAFRVNYYEAARTYMRTEKIIWAILYAEIFINLERVTPRANETRKMLLAAYKRLFTTPQSAEIPTFGSNRNSALAGTFEDETKRSLLALAPVVSDGITVDNLTMLRARFISTWMTQPRPSFSLFSYMDAILREGHFDAYNQWLFGRAVNEKEFVAWTSFNKDAIPGFEAWAQKNPLKPTAADNYNDGKVKGIFLKVPARSQR